MAHRGSPDPIRYTRFGEIFGVHGLAALTRRTYRNSMVWWMVRIVQGLVLGGGLVLFGVVVIVLSNLLGGAACFGQGAVGLILLGIFVLLWFMAAPFTQRWIVGVPEGWYYLVEDGNGTTVEFLGEGRWIVPWGWRTTVRPYVNFQVIETRTMTEDALQSDFLPVTVEASVTLVFDPTQADTDAFDELGRLGTRDAFQQLIARQIEEGVREHLDMIAPQGRALHNLPTLDEVIRQHVKRLDALGLFLPASQPPAVTVRVAPAVREAYFQAWEELGYERYEMPTRLNLNALADALDLPDRETYQLVYLMQRGTRGSRTTAQVARWREDTPRGARPAIQRVDPETEAETFSPALSERVTQGFDAPSIRDTLEHDAVRVDEGGPAEEAPAADVPPGDDAARPPVRDPNEAPDPFDVRRERKARRRASRRVD